MTEAEKQSNIESYQVAVVIAVLSLVAFILVAGWAMGGRIRLDEPLGMMAFILPLLGIVLPILIQLRMSRFSKSLIHIAAGSQSVFPGDVVSGTIELTPSRSLRLFRLDAKVWNGESTQITVNMGKTSVTYSEKNAWLDKALDLAPQGISAAMGLKAFEGEKLPPGTYLYGFSFTVPQEALASWSGHDAWVSCRVEVRARLRHSIDAINDARITVEERPKALVKKPSSFSTASKDHAPGAQSILAELESTEVVVGGTISGRFILSGWDRGRLREVAVQIIEVEWAKAQGHASIHTDILASASLPGADYEGQPVPFTLRIPPSAHPSLTGKISRLSHFVRVHVNVAFGGDKDLDCAITLSRGREGSNAA